VIDLFSVAADVQRFCQERGWRFCFIGGIALQRWGQPRVTQDVDLTLLTGFSQEKKFIDALLAEYQPRRADARDFALMHRVLLLQTATGIGIDISLGGLPFEEAMISRASLFEFLPSVALTTCSAEDLVILKAFANRAKDWADVEEVLTRQGASFDWDSVISPLSELAALKEEPEILDRLVELRTRLVGAV
jgi:hypothetical protein